MGKSPNRKKKNHPKTAVSKEELIVERINSITPATKKILLGGILVVIAALILWLFAMASSQ